MTLSPAAVSDGDFIMESLSRMVNGRRFAPTLLGALKFTDVDRKQGRIGAQITINEAMTNAMGKMDGAAMESLVDIASTAAIVLKAERAASDAAGVSIALNTTLLKPASVNEKIRVRATCLQRTPRIAFSSVLVETMDGATIARGTHTKLFAAADSSGKLPDVPLISKL
ncbi:Thioesterase domain-containing protein [Plasmodiophora brassicae]